MKRFLLGCILSISGYTIPAVFTVPAQHMVMHTPAQGTLVLGDSGQPAGMQRGVIMDTILTNPDFAAEEQTLKNFLGIPAANPITLSYQQIIQKVQQSTDAKGAVDVIEAFEKAIMYQYHYTHYAWYIQNQWANIFVTGVKNSWINPFSWLNPKKWFSDDNKDLAQLMKEIRFLAKIAQKHSVLTETRLNLLAQSYEHWRRNMMLSIFAYFSADAYHRGIDKSSINDLVENGLSSSPTLFTKFCENFYLGCDTTASATKTAAKTTHQYVTKPVLTAICYGKNGFAEQEKKETSTDQKDTNPKKGE